MTIDITAIIVASLSVLASAILGFLQVGKIKAEAKKANTEAQTDLITVALNINKQELDTLRQVNESLRIEIQDNRKRIVDLELNLKECKNAQSKS